MNTHTASESSRRVDARASQAQPASIPINTNVMAGRTAAADNLRRRRAERHAHAKLMHPLRDGVRDQPVESNRRERQRKRRHHRKQRGSVALFLQEEPRHLIHRAEPRNGKLRIRGSYRFLHFRRDSRRCGIQPHHPLWREPVLDGISARKWRGDLSEGARKQSGPPKGSAGAVQSAVLLHIPHHRGDLASGVIYHDVPPHGGVHAPKTRRAKDSLTMATGAALVESDSRNTRPPQDRDAVECLEIPRRYKNHLGHCAARRGAGEAVQLPVAVIQRPLIGQGKRHRGRVSRREWRGNASQCPVIETSDSIPVGIAGIEQEENFPRPSDSACQIRDSIRRK